LSAVVERACKAYRVPYFACKGYTSQSEMYAAGQRMLQHIENGKKVKIFHLGDHDPSGIDMTRDIRDRLNLFGNHPNCCGVTREISFEDLCDTQEEAGEDGWACQRCEEWDFDEDESPIQVERLALNMDQVLEYNPPPNPAKSTDSRYMDYKYEFGEESWELDALEPALLIELVKKEIRHVIDQDLWEEDYEEEEQDIEKLKWLAKNHKDLKL